MQSSLAAALSRRSRVVLDDENEMSDSDEDWSDEDEDWDDDEGSSGVVHSKISAGNSIMYYECLMNRESIWVFR